MKLCKYQRTFFLLWLLLIVSCKGPIDIRSRILDEETDKPIEGAVIIIYWYRYPVTLLPTYNVRRTEFGVFEAVSDSQGNFKIPEFFFSHYHMMIYKKGYICWFNEKIFNPEAEILENLYLERAPLENLRRHIRLQPFKDHFPKDKHTEFIMSVKEQCKANGALITKALQDEIVRDREIRKIRYQKMLKKKRKSSYNGVRKKDVTQYHLEQAKSGNVESQIWIGLAYAKGLEAEKNIVKAYMWLDVAAQNGDPGAAHIRDTIAKKMSTAEIENAKKLLKNWQQNKNNTHNSALLLTPRASRPRR